MALTEVHPPGTLDVVPGDGGFLEGHAAGGHRGPRPAVARGGPENEEQRNARISFTN